MFKCQQHVNLPHMKRATNLQFYYRAINTFYQNFQHLVIRSLAVKGGELPQNKIPLWNRQVLEVTSTGKGLPKMKKNDYNTNIHDIVIFLGGGSKLHTLVNIWTLSCWKMDFVWVKNVKYEKQTTCNIRYWHVKLKYIYLRVT